MKYTNLLTLIILALLSAIALVLGMLTFAALAYIYAFLMQNGGN